MQWSLTGDGHYNTRVKLQEALYEEKSAHIYFWGRTYCMYILGYNKCKSLIDLFTDTAAILN